MRNYYAKGTVLSLLPINEIKFTGVKKNDRLVVSKTLPAVKPDYLVCLKRVDDNHLLCAYAYKSPKKNSVRVENDFRDILYITFNNLISINDAFVKKALISFNHMNPISDEIIKLHKELEITKEKNRKAWRREMNRRKHEAAKRRAYIRIHGNPDDPRTNSNEGVVKGGGRVPSYKSRCVNSEYNVYRPILAGRGNF